MIPAAGTLELAQARPRKVPAGERRRAQRLADLLHHRWAVPILAELHRSRGSKFASLLTALGVSRESLSRTLTALVESGWVMRNPGYGHPLRPEYVLSRKGRRLAPLCAELEVTLRHSADSLTDLRRLEEAVLRKWSLPVLYVLAAGPLRFSALRAALPEITARALTLTLKEMEAVALVAREVTTHYPPATLYASGERRREICDAVQLMGRHI